MKAMMKAETTLNERVANPVSIVVLRFEWIVSVFGFRPDDHQLTPEI